MTKKLITAAIAILLAAAPGLTAEAKERLKVVATFSILGDFVQEVGGEHVSVVTLVGADGDAHAYEPTPADVQQVAEAGAIIVVSEDSVWVYRSSYHGLGRGDFTAGVL